MRAHAVIDLESSIARGRIVLSLVTLVSIFIDPTTPHLAAWIPVASGPFTIDPNLLLLLGTHLTYAVMMYVAAQRQVPAERLGPFSTACDLAFALAVALFTEGPTTPSFVFFAFVIVAAGCRGGFRSTMGVTAICTALYLAIIALLTRLDWHLYLMRPAYLGITGYLIAFLGQQRVTFEERVRELETAAERQSIARFLHDGYAQGLAGINLRLETCRSLLRNARATEALQEVTELQAGVAREFDDVRAYIRSLAEVADTPAREPAPTADPRFHLRAVVSTPASILEQVLHIMLEGLRNTRRHGGAHAATIDVAEDAGSVRITIDDDGVGFEHASTPPWSIASRVAECGGRLRIARERPGAHLEIELPLGAQGHQDAYRTRG